MSLQAPTKNRPARAAVAEAVEVTAGHRKSGREVVDIQAAAFLRDRAPVPDGEAI